MRSRDKLTIKVEMVSGKEWVCLYVDGRKVLVPSFEDLFRILVTVAACEERKYKGRVRDPIDFVRKFLMRTMKLAAELAHLRPDATHTDREYEAAWGIVAREFSLGDEYLDRVRQRVLFETPPVVSDA